MRVHREPGQRVAADRLQRTARIPGYHLDVPVEQHPVARLGPVAIAQRVPAVMCLRVLLDREHVQGRRVGLDAHVGPAVQRPWVGAAAADPALLARRLSAQLEREAGEGRARLAMVGAVGAVGPPDHRLHLGRRSGPRQLQVVPGGADDRRAQRAAAGRGRCVQGLQPDRHARRGRHAGDRVVGDGEPGHCPAGGQAHQRGCPLPARLRHDRPGFGKVVRMAWTCALPGLPAFANSTLASWAATAEAPGIHCW